MAYKSAYYRSLGFKLKNKNSFSITIIVSFFLIFYLQRRFADVTASLFAY